MRKRTNGFTLIEIMVVVAIIAILSAIAISAYGGYITRSKIQAAKGDLSALALNLENELQRNLSYSPRHTSSTDATIATVNGWKPAESSDFNYAVDSSSNTYTLVATGIKGAVVGCELTLGSSPSPPSSGTTQSTSSSASIGQVRGCGSVTSW